MNRNFKKRNNNKTSNNKRNSESVQNLLKQIRDLESYNKGATFKDPVVFPDGRTFDSQIYNIVASVELNSYITTSTVAPTFFAINFFLSLINDYLALTTVFDQYRVKMIQYIFYPRQDTSNSSSIAPGLFHTVIDYDDSALLTTVGQALDYSNCLVTPGDTKQVRTFVPRVANALYNGAFTGYGSVTSPWCDAASTGILHYGIKGAVPIATSAVTYDVITRVWLQFRALR